MTINVSKTNDEDEMKFHVNDIKHYALSSQLICHPKM